MNYRATASLLRGLSASFIAAAVMSSVTMATAHAAPLTVTILGSGSPVPSNVRFSQSMLVEAGSQKLVIDAGRGVTIRLAQLGIPLGGVTATFITHFHSDHTVGLPDLWLTGWLPTPFGSRKTPMTIYGPTGTVAMTKNLTAAFSEDIRTRLADEKLPPAGIAFDAHDIKAGVVYERDGVKVTAFDSHHGDLIEPNFGYVIEYDGKKVVISGDTTYDEHVAQQGKGADLLLHEVADIDPDLLKAYPRFKEITAHHTSPEEAGRIFSIARPKLAAFTHIIVFKANQPLDVPPTEVLARTRTTYDGPLMLGEDLMRFKIDGGEVQVFNARNERIQASQKP
jgi:ribonuclease Z